jgi:hypothetical protein
MVGKPVVMIAHVEITQDEEAAEADPSPPKWPWDPIIETGILPGRWIIGHDGRSVTLIVFLFGNLDN